jgi:hypothetical protein
MGLQPTEFASSTAQIGTDSASAQGQRLTAASATTRNLASSVNPSASERSRWRGGRFACYAPHVMPQRNASNCGSRTCSFSKYRKTNSLQMGEEIEFP